MYTKDIIIAFIYLIIDLIKWKDYKNLKFLLKILMYFYLCLVIFLTVLPIDWTLDLKWKYHSSIRYSCGNIKPFKGLLLGRAGAIKEVVLNIIMTIPLGFLYSFFKKDINLMKIFKSTFILSLYIELTQLIKTIFLLNHRSFDATDLITNTIGGILGYLIHKRFKLIEVNNKTKKYRYEFLNGKIKGIKTGRSRYDIILKGEDNLGNLVEFDSGSRSAERFVFRRSKYHGDLPSEVVYITLAPYTKEFPEEDGKPYVEEWEQIGEEFTIFLNK